MTCVLTIAILKSVLIAQLSTAGVKPTNVVAVHSGTMPSDTSASIAALPPLPSGRSTVIGGAIRSVDPVRDQLTLKVFDSHSMKILFDARTQAFRDGKRIPLRDLEPVEHASIQTMLDGTSVFAVSIHILSQVPHGEMHGQVLSYDASSEELSLRETLSKEPIKVRVPAGTVVTNIGQAASGSDSVASLEKGHWFRSIFRLVSMGMALPGMSQCWPLPVRHSSSTAISLSSTSMPDGSPSSIRAMRKITPSLSIPHASQ